jgi:hypothetical protein
MPNRQIKKTIILLKQETTYGVDSVPTGALNALLVSGISVNPFNSANAKRNNIRPYFGGSEELPGPRYVTMDFSLELAGSGTVATAAAWGAALQSCGFAETLTATIRTDYTPITNAIKSCTIYWHDDGLLHKATGCYGNPTFKLGVGDIPMLSLSFTGLYSTPTVVANPTGVYTAWKQPQVLMSASSAGINLGGTHNAAVAPAIATGTLFPSQGLEIMVNNKVDFNALLGGETVDMSDREMTAKVTFDLDATQEAAAYAAVEAATLGSLGLSHGTVANQKLLIFAPSTQRINPGKAETNGKRLVSVDFRLLPTVGDDELRVVTSF